MHIAHFAAGLGAGRWAAVLGALLLSLGLLAAGDPNPQITVPAAATPATVTGVSAQLSVRADDNGGEANLTYAWSQRSGPAGAVSFSINASNAAKDTVATFSAAGDFTLRVTVTDADGRSRTSDADVTVVPALTALALSPPSAAIAPRGTVTFAASGVDQFGGAFAAPVTWSAVGGTVNSSGRFTAPNAPGSATVTATAVADPALSASATVRINAPPAITTPAAAVPSPVTGTSTVLSVGASDDGGAENLTFTWARVSGPRGATFSVNGSAAASTTTVTFTRAGTYVFRVTVRDAQGSTVTSQTSVTVATALSALAISPAETVLQPGGSRTFSVSAVNQFGATVRPAVTWSAVGGTVTTAGRFTAGTTPGAGSVTAALVADPTRTVTANVRINAPPTVAVAATAVPAAGGVRLSVLGADDGGEAALRYTWASNRSGVVFSGAAQNTNAAKDMLATVPRANSYTFTATIRDAQNSRVTSRVTIVIPANWPPQASPIASTTAEDVPVEFTAAASDPEGAPLAWSVQSPSAEGVVEVLDAATGAVRFTPAPDFHGTATCALAVSDGVATTTVPVTITVDPVNDAPVAAAVAVTTDEDVAVTVVPAASDVDGDALTWSVAVPPASGTLGAIDPATGAVDFTPAANASGTVTFTLAVADLSLTTLVPVTVTVNPVNDAPVIAGTPAATLWFRDGDGPLAIASALTLADIDNANLAGATVRIDGYRAGQDVLTWTNQTGITATWDAVGGTLTFTGATLLSRYQAALRSVRYQNTAAYPSTATRTLAITATDGLTPSAEVVSTIRLVARSTPPWSDGFEAYAAGDDLHAIEALDATRWHAWDANAAATALVSAAPARSGGRSVAITGAADLVHEFKGANAGGWRFTAWQYVPAAFTGQTYFILLNTYRDNGTKNWSTQVSMNGATGKVKSDFDNNQTNLVKGRWVELRVDIDFAANLQRFFYDGVQLYQKSWTAGASGNGALNLAAVDLYANNVGPVYYDDLSLTRIPPSLNASGSVTYTENAASVAVAPALLADGFGVATLASGTVRISGNHAPGEDVLAFADQGGITGAWDAASGTLTLTGIATPAAWQAALRAVTYANTSETPSGLTRTLSLTVNDGTVDSNTVAVEVQVVPVDDPSVISGPATATVLVDSDLVLYGYSVADTDAATVTVSADAGTVSLPWAAAPTVNPDGSVTVSGTAAEVSAALTAIVWRAPAVPGTHVLTVAGNGATATTAVEVQARPAAIAVGWDAPTRIEAGQYHQRRADGRLHWTDAPSGQASSSDTGAVFASGGGPVLRYDLDVAESGTYWVWLTGVGVRPSGDELELEIDGVAQDRRMPLPPAGWPWIMRDTAWMPVEIELAQGQRSFGLRMAEDGPTLGAIVLVPKRSLTNDHAEPVVVAPGAVTVIDGADFDSAEATDGVGWFPAADGSIAALPDVQNVRTSDVFTGGLSYEVFVAEPGDYRLWILGEGDGNADSVFVQVPSEGIRTSISYFRLRKSWQNRDLAETAAILRFTSPGMHTVRVSWREDGVRIHQIAISGEPTWVPFGDDELTPTKRQGAAGAVNASIVLTADAADQMLPGTFAGLRWQPVAPAGALGPAFQALPDNGILLGATERWRVPGALWFVEFPASGTYPAEYEVWLHGQAPIAASSSFHVGLSGACDTASDLWLPVGQWQWSDRRGATGRARITVPGPGVRAVNLWMRADGAVFDRILLQPVGSPVPTLDGPPVGGRVPLAPSGPG